MLFEIILMLGFVSNHQPSVNTFCLWKQISFCPPNFCEDSYLWGCYIQSYQMCKHSLWLILWPHYNQTSCFDNSSHTTNEQVAPWKEFTTTIWNKAFQVQWLTNINSLEKMTTSTAWESSHKSLFPLLMYRF